MFNCRNSLMKVSFIPDEVLESGDIKIDITDADFDLYKQEQLIIVPGGMLFSAVRSKNKIH